MMEGTFREYTWQDIVDLIYEDAGLEYECEHLQRGDMFFLGELTPPNDSLTTVVRVFCYSKDYSERLKDHVRGQ